MAQIILSSRYIKNPKKVNAGKLVKYMGTREGVEKLPKGIESKGHPTFWKQIEYNEVGETKRTFSINNKNYELGLYETKINDKKTYIIDSCHPTARGNIWNETSEYLVELLRMAKELCKGTLEL